MGKVYQDLRYAVRLLAKNPGFSIIAVLTLALGIGANTAIFGVVDSLYLRHPAGVREADDLVRLYIVRNEGMIRTPNGSAGSYVDYRAVRDGVRSFSDAAAFFRTRELDLGRAEEAQRVRGRAVSHSFFPLLGIGMAKGRSFLPEEDSIIGAHPVAVVSHGFWERQLGSDPAVLGRTLLLNGQSLEIIGVAEKEFTGIEPEPVDVWIPMAMAAAVGLIGSGAEGWRDQPFMVMVNVIGRTAPGVSQEAAAAEATTALRHAAEAFPELDPTPDVLLGTLVPAGGPHRSQAASLALWLLLVTALVLVVACANVANLLLSRATTRRRETAVRLSLGASRGRLIRQHLTESLVLSGLGGVAGLLLAVWGAGLAHQFPLPPSAGEVHGRLLAFALVLALITGTVFGFAPAFQAGRTNPADGLKDTSMGAHPKRARVRRALVALQVSVSVVLLIGAGLFVRSLREVYRVDPGLDTERLLDVSVDLSKAGYTTPAREAFYEAALERIRRIPSVERAAIAHFPPFSTNSYGGDFLVPGRGSLEIENGPPIMNWVGPGYFEAVGTAVLRGRGIGERDGAGDEPVAVLNQTLARQIAPGGEAVGMCVAVGDQVNAGGCTRIVGVAEDQRRRYLDAEILPMVYLAHEREPEAHSLGGPHLLIRTRGEPGALAGQVRAALQSLSPDLPYVSVEPLEERIRPEVLPYRLGAILFTLFGALALILAAVGLYGVLGYFVAERRPELGIRRSLGAREADVVRLVIRQGMVPVGFGLAAGLAAAFAGVRLIESMLFGVAGHDPLTFIASAAFLAVVGLVASWVPAQRATKVDPMVTLRAE